MLIAFAFAGLLSSTAGCSSAPTRFCRIFETPDARLDGGFGAQARVDAIRDVAKRVAPADRPLVESLADYTAVLFGVFHGSSTQRDAAVAHFFTSAAPVLDQRLRNECRTSLGDLTLFTKHPKG